MTDGLSPSTPVPPINVRAFGARGDGTTLDTAALQAALDAAAAQGGGTVEVPAGDYPSFTLHLRSGVTLHLAAGATLRAAHPAPGYGGYDPPEPNPWGDELQYQDFGHSHWRNSLLVGEAVENIAITGEGLIEGEGLQRHATYGTAAGDPGPNGTVARGAPVTLFSDQGGLVADCDGHGNKTIALRECRGVTLCGFRLHRGGHFALLATGCRDLSIEDLLIDTNRDGIDLDGCQRVTVRHCTVNSPLDDAIVLKSSYALGRLSPCEDIVIEHCTVSGYDVGSVLDGSHGTATPRAPDQDGPTGRIKIGTETNGDFRRIRIRDCVFKRSRGLALETVDGGVIADVIVERLEMTDITNAAMFLLLGHRARGPAGTPVGALQDVTLRDIRARGVDGRFPLILQGLPGYPLRNLTLQRIDVQTTGGITRADVERQAESHVNQFFLSADEPGASGPRSADLAGVPERPRAYPEPSMFGLLPTSGFFARHVVGLTLDEVSCTTTVHDERPRTGWQDVTGLTLTGGNLAP